MMKKLHYLATLVFVILACFCITQVWLSGLGFLRVSGFLRTANICPSYEKDIVASYLKESSCRTITNPPHTFMAWTSGPETFMEINELAVDSIFKQNPCASIRVLTDQ